MSFEFGLFLFWVIFAIVTGTLYWRKKHPKKLHIEYKCLEHMTPIDRWDPEYGGYWRCRDLDCEVVVDWESRWIHEGVPRPR